MILGVYLRTKPKQKWHLVTVTGSAETAKQDLDNALISAKEKGHDQAEAAIQTFESVWFIPDSLKEVKKEDKLLYN